MQLPKGNKETNFHNEKRPSALLEQRLSLDHSFPLPAAHPNRVGTASSSSSQTSPLLLVPHQDHVDVLKR